MVQHEHLRQKFMQVPAGKSVKASFVALSANEFG
jgi:hypothetical protein